MPRVPPPNVRTAPAPRVDAGPTPTVSRPGGAAPSTTPGPIATAPVDAALPPILPPSETGLFKGVRYDPSVLADVMERFGVADARAVLKTALALRAGEMYLDRAVLEAAAKKKVAPHLRGYRWSPQVLADVMRRSGIASETALLKEAMRHDDGDRVLTRAELERAASVLKGVVGKNDLQAAQARIEGLRGRAGVVLERLGDVDGHPIDALHFSSKRQPPTLRVLVTGGVHGNEPCGTAAALLMAEQLLADPRLRDDVEFTVVPIVNPRGYAAGTRRTPEDVDLNRTFTDDQAGHAHEEVGAMDGLLDGRTFDLALDLHSGKSKRNGFWVLHDGGEHLVEDAMARFQERWPVLHGDVKPYTLQAPGVLQSSNGGTLKAFARAHGVPTAITLEAPGSVSYLDQVIGENTMAHALIAVAREQAVLRDG